MHKQPLLHIEALSPLYEDVQSSEIFPDSKFFVDCIPKIGVSEILQNYSSAKTQAGFDLENFIKTHFSFPEIPDNSYRSEGKTMKEHLDSLWNQLTRMPDKQGGTLIPLPNPYIVPGGRFREIYYWDSYFTMLGLQVSKRMDSIQHMVDNFAHLIDKEGFIPNGNRTYYLGRSQPPFFAMMLNLLREEKGDEVLLKYAPQLEKEYHFWMDGEDNLSAYQPAYRRVVRLPEGDILNRYWDDRDTPRPEAFIEDTHLATISGKDKESIYRHIRAAAESGWDFSSRWFRDGKNMQTIQTTDLIPVDLNCLLYFMEQTLASLYAMKNPEKHAFMVQKAGKRKMAINKYCWNESKGFYFDYHFLDGQSTNSKTLAAVFPLYFSLSTTDQVEKVAGILNREFLHPGGLITTVANTGQQWDAPNGWAPLQWMSYRAMYLNGQEKLAGQIKQNWLLHNEKVFKATGKMMEKYNVMDLSLGAGGGEYPNQDGFGWTNGVYLALKSKD